MIRFEELNSGKYADGLIPAIVQDSLTLKVLMLGFMNEEALTKSAETGKVTFYSRSRNELWTKGDTSGNWLELVSISTDCDKDTLLIRAIPHGPVCHMGAQGCFETPGDSHDATGFIRYLSGVITQRHKQMPEGSYTTRLFEKGV